MIKETKREEWDIRMEGNIWYRSRFGYLALGVCLLCSLFGNVIGLMSPSRNLFPLALSCFVGAVLIALLSIWMVYDLYMKKPIGGLSYLGLVLDFFVSLALLLIFIAYCLFHSPKPGKSRGRASCLLSFLTERGLFLL